MTKNNVITNLKDRQRIEAAKRLTALGVIEEIVTRFVIEGVVYVSERQNSVFPAVLYFATNYPELIKKIKAFEEDLNALVYHVQLTHTQFGEMYAMFYVSEQESTWEQDFEDIESNRTYVKVWNGDIEEIGLIGFKEVMGGIVRTW